MSEKWINTKASPPYQELLKRNTELEAKFIAAKALAIKWRNKEETFQGNPYEHWYDGNMCADELEETLND